MPPLSPDELIAHCQDKGLLLDANLLTLLCIGMFNRQLIKKNKRTSIFTENDFDFLADIVGRFKVLVTTPNILTEVDNLTNRLGYEYLESFKGILTELDERYIQSKFAAKNELFLRLGLSDCALICAANDGYLVI